MVKVRTSYFATIKPGSLELGTTRNGVPYAKATLNVSYFSKGETKSFTLPMVAFEDDVALAHQLAARKGKSLVQGRCSLEEVNGRMRTKTFVLDHIGSFKFEGTVPNAKIVRAPTGQLEVDLFLDLPKIGTHPLRISGPDGIAMADQILNGEKISLNAEFRFVHSTGLEPVSKILLMTPRAERGNNMANAATPDATEDIPTPKVAAAKAPEHKATEHKAPEPKAPEAQHHYRAQPQELAQGQGTAPMLKLPTMAQSLGTRGHDPDGDLPMDVFTPTSGPADVGSAAGYLDDMEDAIYTSAPAGLRMKASRSDELEIPVSG